jgi:hypothetical protein
VPNTLNRRFAIFLWFLASTILLAPISFVATILLVPLWRWLEATLGVEAIGHSGPSEWCYYSVYALSLAGTIGLLTLNSRRTAGRPNDTSNVKNYDA